ncbi:serine hydrolase domain-containing protein [Aquimarina sp. 2201CG14-23]|uniref:serine hydrolase domain-containing protein n=1 Tax=Aquimarina mycalae TaxID=3040073 RepID=UPI002477F5A3|nr:serine hydrolase domain-containing protein [Aquimarina sp. 2201CG14-23]MDH7444225.1 serine hydrolase domain-containing protein [Aquimarina sp. 2201CG14-23]
MNPWKGPDSPGVSFAIIKDGKVISKKNYGFSDIENKTPITSQTRFNLGQSSAHYTAYGLLKLIVAGKLSLNDDARKHIKELQNINQVITVKNLLYGSSGIYDYQVLKTICGWDYTEFFSQKDLLRLVASQKDLTYTPGTDYSETDTNFALIAELIANVSGKSFKAYMEEDVFKPLGMKNTFIKTNESTMYQNVARSYRSEDDNIVFNNSGNTVLGINNMYSCIDDLILWERHINNASGDNQKIVQQMNAIIQLDNGRTNNTSSGELTLGQLYGHKERGMFSTYILGSSGGHDSSIFKFPPQNYTAIALSNNGDGYNGYLGVISAHNIMEAHFPEPETTDFNQVKTKILSKKQLQKHEGHYWDQLGELSREIKVINDTLRYVRTNGNINPLIPLSNNKFQMKVQFDDKIYIEFPEEESGIMEFQYLGAEPIEFKKYTQKVYEKQDLIKLFSGIYINKAYNIIYNIKEDNNKLTLSNAKNESIHFTSITSMLFSGDQWYLRSVEFTKDKNQKINGFYVRNNAIRNLWFEKIELN